ncbi:MAG: quinone-dependent dihydroorotate dehydrogenase [Rhodospirillales bacterium]
MSLGGCIVAGLRLLPAERAHRLTIAALKTGFGGSTSAKPDPALKQRLFGLEFPSPVGLAAGFDKNAEVPDAMLRLGFGFVEIGSVTPRPQAGNPQPRLFRLPEDRAVINRMGFNNDGVAAVKQRLAARDRSAGIVGVNLGKNKDTEKAADDYAIGARELGALADYLVVNVSSPNTPGLRALQGAAELSAIVDAVRSELPKDNVPAVLVKIAPDLGDSDKADIAGAVGAGGIDGLIVSNTTIGRPESLKGAAKSEAGGLSGRPLTGLALQTLKDMRALLGAGVPLIGVGGISNARDAWDRITAGASLIQFYTALVYAGPGLVNDINAGLADRLKAGGFASIADAVGTSAGN